MSKYVKNLVSNHLRERLQGVHDALLVKMVGLGANANNRLRAELQQKNIEVLVVKNSLAARAAAGTPLAPMFEGVTGATAICWGAEDVVALAKEVTRLARDKRFQPFSPLGGVMDGEKLSPQQVEQVSRWPGRQEQLALLVAQILGPGRSLAAQVLGPGTKLAGQVKQLGEEEGEKEEGEGAAPPSA